MKKHPIYPPLFGGTLGFQYNKCSVRPVSGTCVCVNCWCSVSDHSVFIYKKKKKLGGDVKEEQQIYKLCTRGGAESKTLTG